MNNPFGTVYLVGSGPGDPELLTVKAKQLLEDADVVFHDSLVGTDIIEEVPPPETEIVDVGKRPYTDRRWKQEEINRYLAQKARETETVVRLKGGDPSVFGRGGEEAEFLAKHDIPFELIPGVTSAIAGPELAGIPLTHREHASSLTVVTGHEDPTKDESALDWESLAGNVVAGGTLVILMGVSRLPDNTEALREHGVSDDTPVAIIEKVTREEGRVTTGTLGTIAQCSQEAGIEPPAVIVVGDVVGIREDIEEQLLEELPRLADGRDDTIPIEGEARRILMAGGLLLDSTGP